MWDFLNFRRRSRRRGQTTNSETTTEETSTRPSSFTQTYFHRTAAQPFFIPSRLISESPPKCVSRLPCSQILYGERVEDFSTDCWLENHLHRFGLPASSSDNPVYSSVSSPIDIDEDDSVTGSSESDTSTVGYSSYEYGNEDEPASNRPRLAIEELFLPFGDNGLDLQSESSDFQAPPPYSMFPDDPPPTYEEAIGQEDRRSSGTRSSSSSLAFMW